MNPQDDQGHTLPDVDQNDNASTPVDPTQAPQNDPATSYAQPAISDPTLDAQDVDLIEKAWVDKAKSIVDMTQGDPYAQSQELSKMKADYLKKRYNREIEPSD